jgi:hypothetical protein
VTHIVVRAVKLVLVASAAFVILAMVTDGLGTILLEAYFLALGGVLLLALVRTIRVQAPARSASRFDSALAAMRRRASDSGEISLVTDLRLSRVSAFHLHVRLRPLLREVAAHRLWSHYGVDLDDEPARARELVGPAAWELVRPDRAVPADRLGPGLALTELGEVVAELERL